MSFTIVAFGEVLWDLLPSGRFLGGAPFNFAYRVASIGDRGTIISRIGEDELGREAAAILRRLGMETRCVQTDGSHPTGTVPVTLGPDGTADYTIKADVAFDYIEPTAEATQAAASADCLCFGTLIQRRETSRRTLGELGSAFRGKLRFLDLNLRRDCWTPRTVLSSIDRADVLKLNDSEATTVASLYGLEAVSLESFARELLARSRLSQLVVTLGEGGAFAASRSGEAVYDPAYAVSVVDSVGAGDAFAAGFVHGLLEGWPLPRAVRYGNALGGLVATQQGATAPLGAADVEQMLRDGKQRPPDPRFA